MSQFHGRFHNRRILPFALLWLTLTVSIAHGQSSASAQSYNERDNEVMFQGKPDRALADYDIAIIYDPKYAVAYYDRGNARLEKGDREGALADYTRTIELDPKLAEAYNNRGN